jgi:glucan phosphoethanolaminetransferase (alkaline phosphatase superfamily)
MNILEKIIINTLNNLEVILVSSALLSISLKNFHIREKKMIASTAMIFSVLSFFYIQGISSWVISLGGDSFREVNDPDIFEALFFLKSLRSLPSELQMPITKSSLFVAFQIIVFSMFVFWASKSYRGLYRFVFLIALIGITSLVYRAKTAHDAEIREFNSLSRRFDIENIAFSKTSDTELLVYIGESTSSLYMSLYGYPLPTTPQLEALSNEDPGLIKFDGVRATHTHTTPSLLRALAVTVPHRSGVVATVGISTAFKRAGVPVTLYSTQPLSNNANELNTFIFRYFERPAGLSPLITSDFQNKIKDHQLIKYALDVPGVVFFHSYAGHGGYLNNIDPNLSNEIKIPDLNFQGIFGGKISSILNYDLKKEVIDYHRALTYIDRNIEKSIKQIKHRKNPAAFIYFSDHGESVYSRRGHDSSRYIDEMVTVPVLIYFNEAYQRKYPEVYAKYLRAAQSSKPRLLDQIAPSILDIARIKFAPRSDVPTLAETHNHPEPFIVERNTVKGRERLHLDFNEKFGFGEENFYSGTPEPTFISLLNYAYSDNRSICYHRANSYAKALRGASVSNCLEFDLVVDGHALNVVHPPEKITGLQIEHIFKIAETKKTNLWIDAKNIQRRETCEVLLQYLEVNYRRVGKILVEFPSESLESLRDLTQCARRLRALDISISYYLPGEILSQCERREMSNSLPCQKVTNVLRRVANWEGGFTDLSFDYRGIRAVEAAEGALRFRWNIWGVNAREFHTIPVNRFSNIIIDTWTDPNTI